MKRRTFTKSAFVAGTFLSHDFISNENEMIASSKLPSPPSLGSTIGIITPSSTLIPERIALASQAIEKFGFKAKIGKSVGKKIGFLGGSDLARIQDIHAMYADPEVKAIWCGRGGYGATRILQMLDFNLIKKNPKLLIGYSDITALHVAIFQKTGQITLHGPIASSTHNSISASPLKSIFDGNKTLSYNFKEMVLEGDLKGYQALQVINEGQAEGILMGGNLTVLASMIGTPFTPKFKNSIVFLEDVGEEPYRIDRMLTQMLDATDLKKAKAIILGQFTDCEAKQPEFSLTLQEVIHDRLKSIGVPLVMGLPFGHVSNNITLPVGAKAFLDTNKLTLGIKLD